FAVGQQMAAKGGGLGTTLRNAPPAAPTPAPAGADQIYKVALGDAPQKGSAEAKITIVEWSDFQCPFCGRVMDTLRQIEKSYGARVSGAMPFESFKAVLEGQLKRANAALGSGVARKDLYEHLIKDGQSGPPAPPPSAVPQPQARNVDPGDGPWAGSKKPKVTIVEWSDFQGPYCGRVEPALK